MRWGRVRVWTLLFEVPEGAHVAKAAVSAGGKDAAVDVRQDGRRVTLTLSEPLTVAADQALDVVLAW